MEPLARALMADEIAAAVKAEMDKRIKGEEE